MVKFRRFFAVRTVEELPLNAEKTVWLREKGSDSKTGFLQREICRFGFMEKVKFQLSGLAVCILGRFFGLELKAFCELVIFTLSSYEFQC